MDLNEMKKELFYEPKHAMEKVDDVVVKAADDFCEGYKSYLDFAKIERESVEFFVKEAESRGYTEFDNTKKYNAGDKVYFNNRGKAIILCVIGKERKAGYTAYARCNKTVNIFKLYSRGNYKRYRYQGNNNNA